MPSFPLVSTVTPPTIHINGTRGSDLQDEYMAAYEAIKKAIDALLETTLNARDYYPQGNDAYYKARKERTEAFTKLREAQDYVEAMLVGICDQL